MSTSWGALLQVLKQTRWIDSQTRALSLEITIYNVNVNLFTQVKMTIELPASGGVFPYTRLVILVVVVVVVGVGVGVVVVVVGVIAGVYIIP